MTNIYQKAYRGIKNDIINTSEYVEDDGTIYYGDQYLEFYHISADMLDQILYQLDCENYIEMGAKHSYFIVYKPYTKKRRELFFVTKFADNQIFKIITPIPSLTATLPITTNNVTSMTNSILSCSTKPTSKKSRYHVSKNLPALFTKPKVLKSTTKISLNFVTKKSISSYSTIKISLLIKSPTLSSLKKPVSTSTKSLTPKAILSYYSTKTTTNIIKQLEMPLLYAIQMNYLLYPNVSITHLKCFKFHKCETFPHNKRPSLIRYFI